MLPSSLSKLGKSFEVKSQKDIYPYEFPKNYNLSYEGAVPEYKFFDSKKVSPNDYISYVDKYKYSGWNLMRESIRYCERDCISLYQIIDKFSALIFTKFKVSIFKCPTLASLTFRVYRTKFLNNKIIPILDKNLYDILVKSYFGGHVDMYIPESNTKFSVNQITQSIKNNDTNSLETVKHYDINSLYPSVMKDYKYPTDIIGKFIGDIRLVSAYEHYFNNNLGIYKVKVKAPNIKNPILPVKSKGQLLYPYGNWTAWYFSEEIKNAEKYGYEFEILGGYIFDSADLFSSYIADLYKIKETSHKNSAMYLISKLLLNSLYGKMAINPNLNDYQFWTKDDFKTKTKDPKIKENIQDWSDFDSHFLVGVKNKANYDLSNIAVGLAVTAYSRVVMSQFKNHETLTLFYSDTDSLFVDDYLPSSFVESKKLGLYKLEAEYFLFIAIGPKVYGAIDTEGNSYTKVKGFKDKIDLADLESLLNKDTVQKLTQLKWFKSINKSQINIKMSPYDLKPNSKKRIAIYKDNKFVNTESIKVTTE